MAEICWRARTLLKEQIEKHTGSIVEESDEIGEKVQEETAHFSDYRDSEADDDDYYEDNEVFYDEN